MEKITLITGIDNKGNVACYHSSSLSSDDLALHYRHSGIHFDKALEIVEDDLSNFDYTILYITSDQERFIKKKLSSIKQNIPFSL